MTIHTPWIYPISDSRPYATEPGLLKSVEVTPTLISRKGNHFFNFALSIFDNLQFYSLDNSSQVNFLPSFTQFTKLGHEILGNAQALLPEHSAKQSDYFKISTIDQVKKLFDLNNLMIQKPLLTRIRLANMISSPFNFVRAGFQSDFYNKFQKGENSYSYLVSVASSKSSAPIEKLIEMSASHVILDSTIASPLNRAVLTSSMVSQATIAHRIKSQQTEGNSDYWLTDSNIKPNPIENDFVLSSDHPLQPTSFVNMTEELKGSNHGKHLAKIGKELHQDTGLGLFRTRIEQIFNRESSKYSDLQNNLSLADQFSLKYNDNLDENAVPDVKDGQHDEEELEIRILTRKIEQLLNEELRRHGPIIW
jgi:hypothetical protein